MKAPAVAIYAPNVGWGSMRIVAQAAARCCASFVHPEDIQWINGEEAEPDIGSTAPVAFIFGSAKQILASRFATHKQRWYLLAANSTWVPEHLVVCALDAGCNFMVPSDFSRIQVHRAVVRLREKGHPLAQREVDIRVVPHGIPPAASVIQKGLRTDKRFHVLHLAESSVDRKGTIDLIRASQQLIVAGDFELTLVLSERDAGLVAAIIEDEFPHCSEGIVLQTRWNLPQGEMLPRIAKFDLVAQPSRQEGFGLVPLEALSVGVPVVCPWAMRETPSIWHLIKERRAKIGATNELDDLHPAVIDCSAGDEKMVDCGYEDGKVPRWSSPSIAEALVKAVSNFETLQKRAIEQRFIIAKEWHWMAKTEPFLREKYEECR